MPSSEDHHTVAIGNGFVKWGTLKAGSGLHGLKPKLSVCLAALNILFSKAARQTESLGSGLLLGSVSMAVTISINLVLNHESDFTITR